MSQIPGLDSETITSLPRDILVTKLFVPQLRSGLIPRPRLVEKINTSKGKKLVLIHAPAGFGKTTLLSEWLTQIDEPVGWYSLDENDNDIGRFLSYIILAIQGIEPNICTTVLNIIRSPDPPPIDTLLAFILNDLACLERNCILVLDDFHLIDNSEVHYALSFLLQYLPPNLQIMVTSRAELPFSISALRAKDQVNVLDTIDLRFTHEEIADFIAQDFGVILNEENIKVLDQKTEGWATGLQLAAIGMRGQNNISEYIHQLSGDDRLIADYLVDEVLSNQPEDIQRFLIATSIFTRFSSELCNTVLEIQNSQEILEYLEQENLFVIPLDNKRKWYRYHHLFSELLHSRLEALSPEEIPEYYRSASHWFDQHQFPVEAVDYALAAQDFVLAAELLEPKVVTMLSKGGRELVIRLLQSIPKDILRERGYLWNYLILALLDKGTFQEAQGQLAFIWNDLERLEYLTQSEVNQIKGFQSDFLSSITIHTTLDAHKVQELTRLASELLPENEVLGQCIANGHYGSACLQLGEVDTAITTLERAIQQSQIIGYSLMYLLWFSYRAQAIASKGQLSLAKKFYEEANLYANSLGVHKSNVFSNAIIGLGSLYYEWNDLQKAEEYLHEGVSIAETGDYLDRLMMGYLSFIQLKLTTGDYSSAEEKIAFVKTVARKYNHPPIVIRGIETLQAQINLAKRDVKPVLAWLKSVERPTNFDDIDILKEFQLYILTKSWLASGKTNQAIELLVRLLERTRKQSRERRSIQYSCTLASAYQQLGDLQKALSTLLETLELARSENYIRTFLDEGVPIQQLLQKIIQADNEPNSLKPEIRTYIENLLSAFEAESKRLLEIGKKNAALPTQTLLTVREIEVLELLASGDSYAMIAQKLVITENTLKTHIKNIYSKLDVRNRTQAVNNALVRGYIKKDHTFV